MSKERKCKETLCWKCKNSIPGSNPSAIMECPWAANQKPVKGWNAIPHDRQPMKFYGIYDLEKDCFVLNKDTNKPLRYPSRVSAEKDIVLRFGTCDKKYTARILKTIHNISYHVYECPLFEKG